MENNQLTKNKKLIKLRQKSAQIINNRYGFDIYDKKNAQRFNRQFLGLNKSNNQNGIFVGEEIYNMGLPMHKPGEVPDFSNPYGKNFFSKNQRLKLNPRKQPLEYFQKFFGGFGIEFPAEEIMNSTYISKRINIKNSINKIKYVSAPKIFKKLKLNKNKINNNKIKVHRHEIDKNIFDANNISNNDKIFRKNYSFNFPSNLEKKAFDYLFSSAKGYRVLSSKQEQIPIKKDIFNLLKKFEMNEKYMKKKADTFEPPFCCICLQNINLKQKCILLPCRHLFHFQCLKLWLKNNFVCYMCGFNLNDYLKHKK